MNKTIKDQRNNKRKSESQRERKREREISGNYGARNDTERLSNL